MRGVPVTLTAWSKVTVTVMAWSVVIARPPVPPVAVTVTM